MHNLCVLYVCRLRATGDAQNNIQATTVQTQTAKENILTVRWQLFSPTPNQSEHVSVKLNGHFVKLQIDTTSDITVISKKLWETISQPPLTPTKHVVWSASGDCVHLNRN